MGKWIPMFLMIIVMVTFFVCWGLAWLIGGGPDDFFVIGIVLSLQCSLIITLLIAILEKLPKKK
ncbi:hypothetical protein [Saccharococcus thermophilus]|uniref:Uncharacterized protein n=1 Tax=Saccharococcus thermophilus TaxID=29396 RepID=A0A846MHK8_9BACL|nr:hypothetical protein [Saccharococcus thermophilus]NIK14044.1 hypothetical protein [Saccharococcus thermophilus]